MRHAARAIISRGEPALNRQEQDEAAGGHQRREIIMVVHRDTSLNALYAPFPRSIISGTDFSLSVPIYATDRLKSVLFSRCNYGAEKGRVGGRDPIGFARRFTFNLDPS